MHVHAKSLQLCLSLCIWTVAEKSTRLICLWDSPDKNTGVGCHALLQGIFPTQGLNLRLLCLPLWQVGVLYCWATLKILCQNALGNPELFRSGATRLIPLQGPEINLSLLQMPSFQFVWPHCEATWTCVNNVCIFKKWNLGLPPRCAVCRSHFPNAQNGINFLTLFRDRPFFIISVEYYLHCSVSDRGNHST